MHAWIEASATALQVWLKAMSHDSLQSPNPKSPLMLFRLHTGLFVFPFPLCASHVSSHCKPIWCHRSPVVKDAVPAVIIIH